MSEDVSNVVPLQDYQVACLADWVERVRAIVMSGGGTVDAFTPGTTGRRPARLSVRITREAAATLERTEGVTEVLRVH